MKMTTEHPTLQEELIGDRFAQAALSVTIKGWHLKQPELMDLVWHLHYVNMKRMVEKGKPMSDDHLKQEAVKWARSKHP